MLHDWNSLVIILKMCVVCREEQFGQRWYFILSGRLIRNAAAIATIWKLHVCLESLTHVVFSPEVAQG